jgi:hypothetical protein
MVSCISSHGLNSLASGQDGRKLRIIHPYRQAADQGEITGNGCATGHIQAATSHHTITRNQNNQPLGPFLVRFITVSSFWFFFGYLIAYNTESIFSVT